MPSTYLIRGFRWHRASIRMHIMMNDCELCSPDWIIGWTTSEALLQSLHEKYPFIPEPAEPEEAKPPKTQEGTLRPPVAPVKPLHTTPPTRTPKGNDFVLRHQWSAIKILEEYDDKETREHTRPYAFVADYVVRVELDVDVTEEMGKMGKMMVEGDGHTWFAQLNQQLQPDEDIKWYIVVCSDELRSYGPTSGIASSEEVEPSSGEGESRPSSNGSTIPAEQGETPHGETPQEETSQRKKWSASVREKVRTKGSIKNLFKKKSEPDVAEQGHQPGQ